MRLDLNLSPQLVLDSRLLQLRLEQHLRHCVWSVGVSIRQSQNARDCAQSSGYRKQCGQWQCRVIMESVCTARSKEGGHSQQTPRMAGVQLGGYRTQSSVGKTAMQEHDGSVCTARWDETRHSPSRENRNAQARD